MNLPAGAEHDTSAPWIAREQPRGTEECYICMRVRLRSEMHKRVERLSPRAICETYLCEDCVPRCNFSDGKTHCEEAAAQDCAHCLVHEMKVTLELLVDALREGDDECVTLFWEDLKHLREAA